MAKHRYSDTLVPGEYVKHLDKWRKKRAQSRSPYYFAVKKRIERGDTAIVQGWRGDSQRFSLKSPGHLPKGSSAQSIATYIVYAKYELNNQVLFERAKARDPKRGSPKQEPTKRTTEYRGFRIEPFEGTSARPATLAGLGRGEMTGGHRKEHGYLVHLPDGGTKFVQTLRRARQYIDNYIG